jgi:hypothetical protein
MTVSPTAVQSAKILANIHHHPTKMMNDEERFCANCNFRRRCSLFENDATRRVNISLIWNVHILQFQIPFKQLQIFKIFKIIF